MATQLMTGPAWATGDSGVNFKSNHTLAPVITRKASKQTYYTIRFLVDRDLVPDAYRAYAYFRWVDDWLDQEAQQRADCLAFVNRQKVLMRRCYRGDWPQDVTAEERMLVDLIRNHPEQNSGLHAYITNMMAVMAFDAARRGRQISQQELTRYTRSLATAVTEALHYFIGNGTVGPQSRARYLAATAAHITHMLRDTLEDADAGYYNIPREFMTTQGMRPQDVESESYRAWVQRQVQFARTYFKAGRDYLMQVENLRCRIAGFAYMARFEGVLDAIEKEGYRVRFAYPEYKRLNARIRMIWLALRLALDHRRHPPVSHTLGTG